MSLLKTYTNLLSKHFFLVQSIQTGCLMGLGDVLAQKVIAGRSYKDYHVKRTAEFVFLGSVLVGPAVTVWYKFLDKRLGSKRNAQTTLLKVAADQLLFAPGFLIVFLTSVGLMHRDDMEQIKEDFKSKYWDLVTTNWKVWPAFQLMNFYLMPLKYQVVFAQGIAIGWNTYLTWKTGKDD